jgi:hypothetical protein
MRSQAAQINLQELPREDRKNLNTERQEGEHMGTNLMSRMQRPRQPSPESISWRGPLHQESCAGSPLHLPPRLGVTEALLAFLHVQCWCLTLALFHQHLDDFKSDRTCRKGEALVRPVLNEKGHYFREEGGLPLRGQTVHFLERNILVFQPVSWSPLSAFFYSNALRKSSIKKIPLMVLKILLQNL